MLLQISATIGMILFILITGYYLDAVIPFLFTRAKITKMPALYILTIFLVCNNIYYFVKSCVMIYQIWFDVQPNTYNASVNLMIFGFCTLILLIAFNKIKGSK